MIKKAFLSVFFSELGGGMCYTTYVSSLIWFLGFCRTNPATKSAFGQLQALVLYLNLLDYTSNKMDLISANAGSNFISHSCIFGNFWSSLFFIRSIRIQWPALWKNCGWVSSQKHESFQSIWVYLTLQFFRGGEKSGFLRQSYVSIILNGFK